MPAAYLQLVRPANVATALADVLAGYAVAGRPGGGALAALLAATACLYAGGVVLNDFFDREIDRVERPERPIPSGRVAPGRAALLGGLLLAAGVLAALACSAVAGAVAALTAAAILLYDAWSKHRPLLGPVNMGVCRGLNLLLGVAAAPAALRTSWFLAILPLVYIAAVTAVSRGEVHGGRRGIAGFALISLSLVLIALASLALTGSSPWWALLLTAALGWRVLPPFWAAWRQPDAGRIRQAIRAGVLSLVLLDAVIGAAYGGALYSAAILATGIAASALARVFAVT